VEALDAGGGDIASRLLAADSVRISWQLASAKIRTAERLLQHIGTADRTDALLPRSRQDTATSLYGRVLELMCSGQNLPTGAAEPCQQLRDLLLQGISVEEEQDLNEALSGLVDAYQLTSADAPG
jgi:hypothetical protein